MDILLFVIGWLTCGAAAGGLSYKDWEWRYKNNWPSLAREEVFDIWFWTPATLLVLLGPFGLLAYGIFIVICPRRK